MGHFTEGRFNRNRRRKRRSGSVIVIWILLAMALLVGVIAGVTRFYGSGQPKAALTSAAKSRQANFAELKKNTYLVIGTKREGGKEVVTGLLQLVIDGSRRSVGGIIIPTNTFVEVSGRGFEPISEAYAQGIDTLKSTLATFMGIEPQHYLLVTSDLFLAATSEGDIDKMFGQREKTDISLGDIGRIADELEAIPKEKVSLIDLPVKPISLGEQTYFDAKKNELGRLVKLFWGRTVRKKGDERRVIILNGSGMPGVARKAADSLLGKDFKIIDVKNADNFNYPVTQIVIYNDKKSKAAEEVKKLLGQGSISKKNTPQDVVDIVVILGKDFE